MALRGRTENYARVLSEELRTQNLNLPSELPASERRRGAAPPSQSRRLTEET